METIVYQNMQVYQNHVIIAKKDARFSAVLTFLMSGESLARRRGTYIINFIQIIFSNLYYKYREINIVPPIIFMFALITLNIPQRNYAVHTEIAQLTCAFFL